MLNHIILHFLDVTLLKKLLHQKEICNNKNGGYWTFWLYPVAIMYV